MLKTVRLDGGATKGHVKTISNGSVHCVNCHGFLCVHIHRNIIKLCPSDMHIFNGYNGPSLESQYLGG